MVKRSVIAVTTADRHNLIRRGFCAETPSNQSGISAPPSLLTLEMKMEDEIRAEIRQGKIAYGRLISVEKKSIEDQK